MRIIKKYLKQEDYENNDKEYLYNIFTKKITEISYERELLPYHEFIINYDEKFCIFTDFVIDYVIYSLIREDYKIILKPRPKMKNLLLFNIFIFNH